VAGRSALSRQPMVLKKKEKKRGTEKKEERGKAYVTKPGRLMGGDTELNKLWIGGVTCLHEMRKGGRRKYRGGRIQLRKKKGEALRKIRQQEEGGGDLLGEAAGEQRVISVQTYEEGRDVE